MIEIIYKWNFKAIILLKSNLDFNSLTIVCSLSFLFFLKENLELERIRSSSSYFLLLS